MSHRIRLKAGWHRQLGPAQTKIDLPDATADNTPRSSGDATLDGPVCYRRTFNCPTGLESGTRVDLIIDSWIGHLTLHVDDTLLAGPLEPSAEPLRVPIASHLRGHHQLTIELAAEGDQSARLTGIVWLEIVEPDL